MKHFLLVLVFPLLALSTVNAQVVVSALLDINAEVDGGNATVSATQTDIGSAASIFDLDTGTLMRTPAINPAEVTVVFDTPRSFSEFEVMVAGNASNITIEAASTPADLDSKSGTYQLIRPTVQIPNETLSTLQPVSTPSLRAFRLTVERLFSDDYVHIREWRFRYETQVVSIEVEPRTTDLRIGQTKQLELVAFGPGNVVIADADLNPEWTIFGPQGVVSVDSEGRITGVSAGVRDVWAFVDSLSSRARVTVQSGEVTDLNVTYIQRLPEYDYNATKNRPAPGEVVQFVAHIRQWGGRDLTGVDYRWLIDGVEVQTGTLPTVAAESEVTTTLDWDWESSRRTITFELDTNDEIAEESESNNSLSVASDALLVGFWVERSLYEYFQDFQENLGVGSNSWEDWAQRQIEWWNGLNEQAVWDETPEAVIDRVALNKIILVEDNQLPLNGGLPTNNPDLSDRTVDYMWGFPSRLLDPNFYANTSEASDLNPFYRERSLIHELGHARYLIDHYGFDVFNNAQDGGHDSVQIFENGQPVAGSSMMPFKNNGIHLYDNRFGGIMTGPFGFRWSLYEVLALNRIAGDRARCGNYNAPCNIGEFLQLLPLNNIFQVTDTEGRPLANADIRVYQSTPGTRQAYSKTIDNTPDLFFTTDCLGRANLGRNPWGGAGITHNPGWSNGVIVIRIEHTSGLWYEFFETPEASLQHMLGNTQTATYTRQLSGAIGADIPADFNRDTLVDTDDVTDIIDAISAQSPEANLNGDDQVDAFDLLELLERIAAYVPGC